MTEFKAVISNVTFLCGVRWYVAYPISYRQLEERMEERGAVMSQILSADATGE